MRKQTIAILVVFAIPMFVFAAQSATEATTTSLAPITTSVSTTTEEIATSTTPGGAIAGREDTFYTGHARYLQVLPGNVLPSEESGTVADLLGASLPADAHVDIYDGPEGKGYQVFYTDGTTTYSVGYGPEAKSRTYQQAHKYENGINRISAGRLYEIAWALNAPVAYFYEGLGQHKQRVIRPHRRMLLDIIRNFGDIQNEQRQEAVSQLARALAGTDDPVEHQRTG